MTELAKIHTERLKELKQRVSDAHAYFEDNIKRFEKFMTFVFKSSLNNTEAAALTETGKPNIEFNILEAYISRLRGEFAKQQPSLSVRAADGVPLSMLTKDFTETINLVESHLRSVFNDSTNDMLDYNVYSELLAGGFSVLRVYTDYVNEMSFEQNICVEKTFDSTLTIFDPLARASHKGDGRFCAEIYPMTRKDFELEFGEEAAKKMKFTRNLDSFSWSFQNDREEIVLVCVYYEKKRKKETIYKLTNGYSVTKKDYEEFLKAWDEEGVVEQPPAIIKERKTTIENIVRYKFCENKILSYIETDFKYLPLVFADGNSVNIKDNGNNKQMTRPYVYHAEGIQRLKNFAGQSLANELENTVQHKFVVALESIPDDYLDAYENVQKPDVLIYNHFLDTNNPNITLPPPREVMRTPIPPQISDTFRMSDEMTQAILGSYDSAAGVNRSDMSGIAFARSAIQSNNASVPFVVGYIKALNRVAQIIVDLIPKYYRTPRSIPIVHPNGKKDFVTINKSGSVYMNFDPNSLQVKVEAGVNFAMQREIALQTVVSLCQSNSGFAEFFNEVGLMTILENIDMRGIDELKKQAETYIQRKQQQQQAAMQQQQSQGQTQANLQEMQAAQLQKELQAPTLTEIGAMSIQEKAKVDAANIAIKERDSQTKFIETMSKVQVQQVDSEVKLAEVDAERTRTAVEAAINLSNNLKDNLQGGTEIEIS